jgi:hypothetical protein
LRELYQKRLREDGRYTVLYQDLSIHETTFKGKLDNAIQSWFRLTPSYSPDLVDKILEETRATPADKVLDPFVGTGTTLIECKLKGIDSIGVEINPIFYDISSVSTCWNHDVDRLQHAVETYLTEVAKHSEEMEDIPLSDFPSKLGIQLPRIFNVGRWWRDDVLKDLLIARQLIPDQEEEVIKRFLRMGLVCILVEVANIARMHPTLTLVDRTADQINVLETLRAKLVQMTNDIKEARLTQNPGKVRVILGDSTKLSTLVPRNEVTLVITSPPYPNRISYVWETRPHLYFFEIFSKPVEAALLDIATIGGTWGKATSILQRGVIVPSSPTVKTSVGPIAESIRSGKAGSHGSNLMANYVMKYFNMMCGHLEELARTAKKGCRCAYVVGNSRIKGVDVPTDLILADLFESTGFKVSKIVRTRKRIGRKRLYEAVVYAELQ